jgi:hypothetical protein
MLLIVCESALTCTGGSQQKHQQPSLPMWLLRGGGRRAPLAVPPVQQPIDGH